VINGRKWYTTGATDPRCKIMIFMGKTDPDNPDTYRQQSIGAHPQGDAGRSASSDAAVFGYYGWPDRAAEVVFENVQVPVTNILLGEGRGFEIAQGVSGPVASTTACASSDSPKGSRADVPPRRRSSSIWQTAGRADRDARAHRRVPDPHRAGAAAHIESRLDDGYGRQQSGKAEIAMIKVAAPQMACRIIDWAIQVFGGAGTNDDYFLGAAYATAAACGSRTDRTRCTATRSGESSSSASGTGIPSGRAGMRRSYRLKKWRRALQRAAGRCRERAGKDTGRGLRNARALISAPRHRHPQPARSSQCHRWMRGDNLGPFRRGARRGPRAFNESVRPLAGPLNEPGARGVEFMTTAVLVSTRVRDRARLSRRPEQRALAEPLWPMRCAMRADRARLDAVDIDDVVIGTVLAGGTVA